MRPKALLILSLAMMLTPSFLYWFGPLRRPAMVDGDRLQMMACPECGGSGAVAGHTCPRCHGRKNVQFLIPSPDRPTYVVGHVYAPDSVVPVPNAQVDLATSAGSLHHQTDASGRFGADLPPGTYPLSIQSAQGRLQTTLQVVPQTQPEPVDRDVRFPSRQDSFTLQR